MPLGFAIAGQPRGRSLHGSPCHSEASEAGICFPLRLPKPPPPQ